MLPPQSRDGAPTATQENISPKAVQGTAIRAVGRAGPACLGVPKLAQLRPGPPGLFWQGVGERPVAVEGLDAPSRAKARLRRGCAVTARPKRRPRPARRRGVGTGNTEGKRETGGGSTGGKGEEEAGNRKQEGRTGNRKEERGSGSRKTGDRKQEEQTGSRKTGNRKQEEQTGNRKTGKQENRKRKQKQETANS